MSSLNKRNSEIIQTRNEGTTYQEISDLFGLSRERVRQIIVRSELEKKQKLQSEKILAIIKTTEIKKKWVGGKTCASLVEHLSQYDLGHTFNAEWEKRIKKLMQHSIKHGVNVISALR